MSKVELSAEDLGAETMVSILRGAVVYARENKEGRGPPMITLGDASRAADIIERVTRERDAARREAATFRHDTSVALAALDDAKKLAMRQASEIRRLAGPREPPHCQSCDCIDAQSLSGYRKEWEKPL